MKQKFLNFVVRHDEGDEQQEATNPVAETTATDAPTAEVDEEAKTAE